jgi:hypothetical protein
MPYNPIFGFDLFLNDFWIWLYDNPKIIAAGIALVLVFIIFKIVNRKPKQAK